MKNIKLQEVPLALERCKVKMQDFLGNDLNIGDEVVFMDLSYLNLRRARIIAFTPEQIQIEYKDFYSVSLKTSIQFPDQIVKVIKNVY